MTGTHTLDVLEFPRVKTLIAELAASAFGREAVEQAEPLSDPDDIREQLAFADEMAQAVRWGDPVPMGGLRDIRNALAVAEHPGSRIDPTELLELGDTIRSTGRIKFHFGSRREKYPRIADIASAIEDTSDLAANIDRIVDGGGFVKDSASSKLARLRRDLDQERQSLRSGLDRMVNRLSDDVVGDRVVSFRGGRPVIPIRATHRNRLPGIVHDQSATGQTIFVEPMESVEQSNHIRQLELDEEREVERILTELTDAVREHVPAIRSTLNVVRELDRLYAIASYADASNGVAPTISDDGTFELVEMRHPLLDERLRAEGGEGAVPVTVRLTGDQRIVVVSGPNAGGKTVALKTIGLASVMAQAGFLVPAGHLTVLPAFSTVFAEIGDEQSIEQDLSTFSSRMGHLARISDEADSDTLVLVDELGSATDPEQGAALSRALLSRWGDRGALAVVTTHLGALKEFAHEHPSAANASMEFDQESLSPTFRLHLGIPGSSYALEISRRVGLEQEIIDDAERQLGEDVVRTEELIADLTTRLERAVERERELERRARELETRESEYEERFSAVRADQKRLVREANEKAEKILLESRALVERTVAELRRTQASSDAIREGRHSIQESLAETRKAIEASAPEPVVRTDKLEVGDWVRVASLGLTGELVALDKHRGAVQTDTARMEVSADQIERAGERPRGRATKGGGVSAQTSAADTFRPEIDVRGLTFDDAWTLVDRYLDDAVLARYPRVRIIHGKGTGALRKKFGEQLAGDDRAGSHTLGELHEGGIGVTVVNVRS